jgi:hypothetical protein
MRANLKPPYRNDAWTPARQIISKGVALSDNEDQLMPKLSSADKLAKIKRDRGPAIAWQGGHSSAQHVQENEKGNNEYEKERDPIKEGRRTKAPPPKLFIVSVVP